MQENDENLWDYLIDLSLTSKENVQELLTFAAEHKIDPVKLIRKVHCQAQPCFSLLSPLINPLANSVDPRKHGD